MPLQAVYAMIAIEPEGAVRGVFWIRRITEYA